MFSVKIFSAVKIVELYCRDRIGNLLGTEIISFFS